MRDPEYPRTTHAFGIAAETPDPLTDFLFLTPADPHTPADVFPRLRWGGQVIVMSDDPGPVAAAAEKFSNWHPEQQRPAADWRAKALTVEPGSGATIVPHMEKGGIFPPSWIIEQLPTSIRKFPFNLRVLPFGKTLHYFIARKVALIEPGAGRTALPTPCIWRGTRRCPHQGPRGNDAYVVVKEIPTTERVLARLQEKFPEADPDTLKRRARKFTEKIFPVFLTRETAILKLLQRDLPREFRHRVPRVLSVDQDAQGYTRTLRLNWLRNGLSGAHRIGGESPPRPLTQLEFARQAAELLAALHDHAHIMHLDLRLDNFVITPQGVGFVDFGSAVRVGEAFPEASLLSNLFGEMMRTSQIQRMLGQMSESGQVTSEAIKESYHRIDKAVDFFYLAVQINNPHANPDFIGLVKFEKKSPEVREISRLTDEILRPADPKNPAFKSAKQILEGILEIENRLYAKSRGPR